MRATLALLSICKRTRPKALVIKREQGDVALSNLWLAHGGRVRANLALRQLTNVTKKPEASSWELRVRCRVVGALSERGELPVNRMQ